MSEKEEEKVQQNAENEKVEETNSSAEDSAENTDSQNAEEPQTDNAAEEKDENADKVAELQAEIEKQKKDYLLLYADFQNYKKRVTKEKADLIVSAGDGIFKDLLTVVDDFDRAVNALQNSEDVQALKDGVDLIHKKFTDFLTKNGVTPIDTENADFDTNVHEAIATFPAGDDKKNKVIDCTQKGYMHGEKVLRIAKVVVGA